MNNKPPQAAERLNALLQVELAAVLAYQHSLRSLDGRLGDDTRKILEFATEHQRTVAALQGCIRTLGGVAASEPGTWGSFALLRDEASVQRLLEAEQLGLAEYETALPILDGDVRELVEQELIPRQREHVATLSRILSELSPT